MDRRSLAIKAVLACLVMAAPGAAEATDFGTTQWGNATVTLGGGLQSLFVPDNNFIQGTNAGGTTVQNLETNDVDGELGFGLNGELLFPTAMFGAQSMALRGFYGSVSHDSNRNCSSSANFLCTTTPIIDDGTAKVSAAAGNDLATDSDRDVHVWGVALEGRRHVTGPTHYFALGGDIRGLNQSLDLSSSVAGASGTADYKEDLDTTYYGIYLAYGRDYTLPFLGAMTSSWGLQSAFRAWGGIYYADTDYSGTYTRNLGTNANQKLSLSDSSGAFIGGVTFETRKPISNRTALTLRTDYEYYSYAPEMKYNETVNGNLGSVTGTHIDDDDAFSIRSTLNLTIGLGPEALYSDARLKRDIHRLATLDNGLKIYSFKYLWSDETYVGVMAQDLLAQARVADAVQMTPGGYYKVDYGKLGLRMTTLADWQRRHEAAVRLQPAH